MRFRLRTLLIVLAVAPLVLWAAWGFWMAFVAPPIWEVMFGEPHPSVISN